MSIKMIGRASLAVLVGVAALGLTGCELGAGRNHQDDDGYTRWEPPQRWPDRDHEREHRDDRDHGRDHDRDHGRDHDGGHDRDRGERERDHDRRSSLETAPDARAVAVLASLDGDAAGKLFDGRR